MSLARNHRRRSPIVLLLALVVTVVVLITATVRSGHDRKDQPSLAYLDEVALLVGRSNQLGEELVDLRIRVSRLSRTIMSRRSKALAHQAEELVQEAEKVEVSEAFRTTHSMLVTSLVMRAAALADLRSALDAALRARPREQATSGLMAVGADLLVADRTYQMFLARLPSTQKMVPESRWIPAPQTWEAPAVASLVADLRSNASLHPLHDVAILTVTTRPAAVGLRDGVEMLPIAKTLLVDTVVANIGNEYERQVEVVATLTTKANQADIVRRVINLGPGQRLALRMGGLTVQAPQGQRSTLTVKVQPVAREVGLADNQTTKTIVMP